MTDFINPFKAGLTSGAPWESIVDFATHRSFCGRKLYPKQLTLLKLIYLEREHMTDYDLNTIGEWTEGFKNHVQPWGVPPDVWDRVDYLKANGYTHFTFVQFVGGRRGSKGVCGGIVGTERLSWMYSLGDWQSYFSFVEGSSAELIVVATSQAQAARRQFKDIRLTVENCEYLKRSLVNPRYSEFSIQTPGDIARIDRLRAEGVPVDPEHSTLFATASSSVSTSQRGGSSFCNMFDEFAHVLSGSGSVKSSEEIFEAYDPSLDQFGVHAMTWMPSSPFTMIGQFYELYQQGRILMDVYSKREGALNAGVESLLHVDAEEGFDELIADPTKLIIQLPSWSLYEDWEISQTIPTRKDHRMGPMFRKPVQWPPWGDRPENVMQARRKLRNPEKFRVEREAQFATVQDAYLDPVKVDKMFDRPWWYTDDLEERHRGLFSIVYRAHADPSRTNANFGFAIAHIEDAPCDECGWIPQTYEVIGKAAPVSDDRFWHNCPEGGHVWPHVILDKLQVWRPEDFPEHTVDYVQIGEEIDDALLAFPSTEKMSYDQYNSAGFIAAQKRRFPNTRVFEHTFTPRQNQDRFEKFKSALNLGLVHSYRDSFYEGERSLLELELKFLQETNGKVDKMDFGPVKTKDLADAVMVVTCDLLHEHLDRWYKNYNRPVFGSTITTSMRAGPEMDRLAASGLLAPSLAPSPRGDGARTTTRGLQNRLRLEEQQRDRTRGTIRSTLTRMRSRGRYR